jgi:hypothetical protein
MRNRTKPWTWQPPFVKRRDFAPRELVGMRSEIYTIAATATFFDLGSGLGRAGVCPLPVAPGAVGHEAVLVASRSTDVSATRHYWATVITGIIAPPILSMATAPIRRRSISARIMDHRYRSNHIAGAGSHVGDADQAPPRRFIGPIHCSWVAYCCNQTRAMPNRMMPVKPI